MESDRRPSSESAFLLLSFAFFFCVSSAVWRSGPDGHMARRVERWSRWSNQSIRLWMAGSINNGPVDCSEAHRAATATLLEEDSGGLPAARVSSTPRRLQIDRSTNRHPPGRAHFLGHQTAFVPNGSIIIAGHRAGTAACTQTLSSSPTSRAGPTRARRQAGVTSAWCCPWVAPRRCEQSSQRRAARDGSKE